MILVYKLKRQQNDDLSITGKQQPSVIDGGWRSMAESKNPSILAACGAVIAEKSAIQPIFTIAASPKTVIDIINRQPWRMFDNNATAMVHLVHCGARWRRKQKGSIHFRYCPNSEKICAPPLCRKTNYKLHLEIISLITKKPFIPG